MKDQVKKLIKKNSELKNIEVSCEEEEKQLQSLKDWLKENPHLRCRTDDLFLMRFLRFRKFKQKEARDSLEKYIKMRVENGSWFSALDVRDPNLAELIDGGYFFTLPERDAHGRRVIFSRVAAIDPSRHSTLQQMRVIILCLESMLEDPVNQKRGFTYIMDEKDVGFSFLSMWGTDITRALNCCEKTLPAQHKDVNFLNLSFIFYAVFEFVKSLLSFKMRSRLKVHSKIESLHEIIDKKILPEEYGGSIPMSKMIKSYREELEKCRGKVLSLDNCSYKPCSKS